jgi:predicted NUDIX family NTP pyrophosphohydrolase
MPNDSDNTAGSDCPSPPCSLWRSDWEERSGKMEPVRTTDLFAWACVNTTTGEVEMTGIKPYDDELNENLVEGWEWRRFRLIEANKQL